MPFQDWNLKASFDGAYSFHAEPDGHPNTRPAVRLHYHRGPMANVAAQIAQHFDSYIGPAAYNQRFAIIGGGFGWVAGELMDRGFTNVVVAEISAWVLAEMDNSDEQEVRDACAAVGLDPNGARADELVAMWARPGVPRRRRRGAAEDVPIINANITAAQGRTAVQQALGGMPQIVVTEVVLQDLSDAEAIQLAAACKAWGGQQTVVHIVATDPGPDTIKDADYNWKSLAAWKALIPPDIFIDSVSGEVLE